MKKLIGVLFLLFIVGSSPVHSQNGNPFMAVLEKIDTLSMDVTPSSPELELLFNEVRNLPLILEPTKKEMGQTIASLLAIEGTIATLQADTEENEKSIATLNVEIQSIQKESDSVHQKRFFRLFCG